MRSRMLPVRSVLTRLPAARPRCCLASAARRSNSSPPAKRPSSTARSSKRSPTRSSTSFATRSTTASNRPRSAVAAGQARNRHHHRHRLEPGDLHLPLRARRRRRASTRDALRAEGRRKRVSLVAGGRRDRQRRRRPPVHLLSRPLHRRKALRRFRPRRWHGHRPHEHRTAERPGQRHAAPSGKGSEFIIQLPLTLATTKALMVMANDTVYAIPLVSVTEALAEHDADIHSVGGRRTMRLRGRLLPIVDLADALGDGAAAPRSSAPVRCRCTPQRPPGRLPGGPAARRAGRRREVARRPHRQPQGADRRDHPWRRNARPDHRYRQPRGRTGADRWQPPEPGPTNRRERPMPTTDDLLTRSRRWRAKARSAPAAASAASWARRSRSTCRACASARRPTPATPSAAKRRIVLGAYLTISGDVTGHVMLLFPVDARARVRRPDVRSGRRAPRPNRTSSPNRRSANWATSSARAFVNALADHVNLILHPSPPTIVHDMAIALVRVDLRRSPLPGRRRRHDRHGLRRPQRATPPACSLSLRTRLPAAPREVGGMTVLATERSACQWASGSWPSAKTPRTCSWPTGSGSCIGVSCLRSAGRRCRARAHPAARLRTARRARRPEPARFADTGIDVLVQKMVAAGASPRRLVVKLAGGAAVLGPANAEKFKIGETKCRSNQGDG